MKSFKEQFKKQSERIRLSSREKGDLKNRLVSYMEYHPLTDNTRGLYENRVDNTFIPSPSFAFRFSARYVKSFAGLFVVFMVVAIPVFAEKSLPGDVLYPMKVQFNEELRSTLSFSPHAKIEWETARLERRISEARLLAKEGRLTDDAERLVTKAIKKHSDNAQQRIVALREKNEDEATMAELSLVSSLSVQAEVLESELEKIKSETNDFMMLGLTASVREARDTALALYSESPITYQRLIALLERETTYAFELYATLSFEMSEAQKNSVERSLQDIDRKIEFAKSIMDTHGEKEGIEKGVDGEVDEVIHIDVNVTNKASTTKPNINIDTGIVTTTSATGSVKVDISSDEGVKIVRDEVASTRNDSLLSNASNTDSFKDLFVENDQEAGNEFVLKENNQITYFSSEISEHEAVAISVLREALADTRKLISFMTDIDVRNSVSLERLVPVTPTREEKVEFVIHKLDYILLNQKQLETKNIEGFELEEDILSGKEELKNLVEKTAKLLEEGETETAVETVKTAEEVMVSLMDKLELLFEVKNSTTITDSDDVEILDSENESEETALEVISAEEEEKDDVDNTTD